MKFHKFELLLLIFFSFSLNSQTLKDNREKNKISVSLGYNLMGGSRISGAKALSLDYSITSNWKVGTYSSIQVPTKVLVQ